MSNAEAAAVYIRALLAGNPPNGTPPDVFGDWRDLIGNLLQAHASGGTPALRAAWTGAVRRTPELAALASSERVTPVRDESPPPPRMFPLTLPETVWRGVLKEYRDMLRTTTEASDAYHLFTILACAGSLLGRSAYVLYGLRLYGNMYVTLVGPTGESRKTTTLRHAEQTGKAADPQWHVLHGVSTAEGLIAQVADPWEHKDKNGKVIAQGGTDDKRLLVWLGELSAFLHKARQERIAHVIPFLADAWDCLPELDLPTRNTPLKVTNPYMSLVSASTPEWLESSLTDRQILGGFANRFLFVLGEQKAPIPFPDPPSEHLRNKVVMRLVKVRQAWGDREDAVELTPEARQVWADFYRDWKSRPWPDPLMAALLQRIPDQCLKIALLYAVLEESSAITDELLRLALDVGKYAVASAQRIFGAFYASREARHEAKIRKTLEDAGGSLPIADLQRKLSGRISSAELSRVLGAWQSTGQADVFSPQGDQRRHVRLL